MTSAIDLLRDRLRDLIVEVIKLTSDCAELEVRVKNTRARIEKLYNQIDDALDRQGENYEHYCKDNCPISGFIRENIPEEDNTKP